MRIGSLLFAAAGSYLGYTLPDRLERMYPGRIIHNPDTDTIRKISYGMIGFIFGATAGLGLESLRARSIAVIRLVWKAEWKLDPSTPGSLWIIPIAAASTFLLTRVVQTGKRMRKIAEVEAKRRAMNPEPKRRKRRGSWDLLD